MEFPSLILVMISEDVKNENVKIGTLHQPQLQIVVKIRFNSFHLFISCFLQTDRQTDRPTDHPTEASSRSLKRMEGSRI